ncbi:MAG TPA: hypothetical protein VH593_05510 [Ktedonobacteraceae bacterium]|jgi:hypothetical protein
MSNFFERQSAVYYIASVCLAEKPDEPVSVGELAHMLEWSEEQVRDTIIELDRAGFIYAKRAGENVFAISEVYPQTTWMCAKGIWQHLVGRRKS